MVICIRELTLQGVAVKIEDLAIFSLGIKTKPADSSSKFSAQANVESFYLRSRATGQFTRAELKTVASISEMDKYMVEDEAADESENA